LSDALLARRRVHNTHKNGQHAFVVGVFARSDGGQFAWGECGAHDGRPVFFLHGAPGSVIEGANSPFSARFASSAVRFIAVERAGYGISTARAGRRFIDIADDIRSLADYLALDVFTVVGWSTGGPHALACSAALDDRVRAVGIVASCAPLDKVGLDGFGERTFIEMAQQDPNGLREVMKQLAAAMHSDPEGTTKSLLADVMTDSDVAYCARPGQASLVIADLVESARGDWEGYADDCIADAADWGFALGGVKAPVSVVHGIADRLVPVEHSRYLAKALPNASLLEVEGEGHISVLDHLPRLCAELVDLL
jgi:pimeloyl-ACP methyl ester carboxylesterase